MRILIIGSSGFIGSKILKYSEILGYESCGISRAPGIPFGLTLKNAYFENGAKNKSYDLIINAAGVSNNNKSAKDYLIGNINIANDIVKFFSEYSIPVINISAACIYNNNEEFIAYESSKIINPDAYSISKLAAEQIFNEANHPVLNVRLPAVIGSKAPTSWPVRLLNNKKNGIKNSIFNSNNLYNHVIHINNLCEFLLSKNTQQLIKNKETVNLCSDDPITFFEAANMLLESNTFEAQKTSIAGFILSNNLAKKSFGFNPWTVESALDRFKKEFYE